MWIGTSPTNEGTDRMRNTNVSILTALLVALSTGLAKASVADESHPPQLLPCSRALASPDQAWSSPPPAAKQLANLNVGPSRTVRLIYFLPNDRPYRAEEVNRIKTIVRQVQTFYAEQMQAHGYENRAFRFETDAAGEPKVHRVDGQYSDRYYSAFTLSTVQKELRQKFDLYRNIYIVVIDNSDYGVGVFGRLVGGVGSPNGKIGGVALFSEESGFVTMAHELGHAFGLEHDFRDDAYIMSYGPGGDQLSACAAGILAVHPYFKRAASTRTSYAQRPTIELISPWYPAGASSASVQLSVRDSEGLHQVNLFAYTRVSHFSAGAREVKACHGLGGKKRPSLNSIMMAWFPLRPLRRVFLCLSRILLGSRPLIRMGMWAMSIILPLRKFRHIISPPSELQGMPVRWRFHRMGKPSRLCHGMALRCGTWPPKRVSLTLSSGISIRWCFRRMGPSLRPGQGVAQLSCGTWAPKPISPPLRGIGRIVPWWCFRRMGPSLRPGQGVAQLSCGTWAPKPISPPLRGIGRIVPWWCFRRMGPSLRPGQGVAQLSCGTWAPKPISPPLKSLSLRIGP